MKTQRLAAKIPRTENRQGFAPQITANLVLQSISVCCDAYVLFVCGFECRIVILFGKISLNTKLGGAHLTLGRGEDPTSWVKFS